METWDAIRARRDVREFTDRPVEAHDLERILEAGRRAPSARNRQPWDFVVVTDRERLRQLAQVWRGAPNVAGSAVTVAVVGRVPDDPSQLTTVWFDLGQAVLSMSLAAVDLGIATGHSAVADQALAQALLGFPDGHFCAHLLPLGYPADRPLRPLRSHDRRPFDDVVHRDRW